MQAVDEPSQGVDSLGVEAGVGVVQDRHGTDGLGSELLEHGARSVH